MGTNHNGAGPARLVSMSYLESAWGKACQVPEYQRAVAAFFKGAVFLPLFSSELWLGTHMPSRRRGIYCTEATCARVAAELAGRAFRFAGGQEVLAPALRIENVEDLVSLEYVHTEADVKALFREIKRSHRAHKQGQQLAGVASLLRRVRAWVLPLRPELLSGSGLEAPTPGDASPSDEDSQLLPTAPGEEQLVLSHPVPTQSIGSLSDMASGLGSGNEELPSARTEQQQQDSVQGSGTCAMGRVGDASCNGLPIPRLRELARLQQEDVGPSPCSGIATGPGTVSTSCATSPAPTPGVASTPWPPGTPRFARDAEEADYVDLDEGEDAVSAAALGLSLGLGLGASPGMSAAPGSRLGAGGDGAAAGRGGRAQGGGCSSGRDALVVCCSLDMEFWEHDNSKITEVGWTLWDNLSRQLVSRHFIVSEYEHLRNRVHVPDHKDAFLFGDSAWGSLAQGAAMLLDDMHHHGRRRWEQHWAAQRGVGQEQQGQQEEGQQAGQQQQEGADGGLADGEQGAEAATLPPPMPPVQLLLVGHGMAGDLKALSTMINMGGTAAAAAGVGKANGSNGCSNGSCGEPGGEDGEEVSADGAAASAQGGLPRGTALVDTADMGWAWAAEATAGALGKERMNVGLRVLLKMLDIPAHKLHNGGNDARYTLEALLVMADALEVEQLKEERSSSDWWQQLLRSRRRTPAT